MMANVGLTIPQAIWLGVLVIGIWLVPYLTDVAATYRRDARIYKDVVGKLIGNKTIDQIPPDSLKQIGAWLERSPTGISGLVRSLLGLTVFSVIGVALFLTLTSGGDAELAKTIVTALLAILGTVTGFYFGSKSTQDAAAASLAATLGGAPPSTAPAIATVMALPDTLQGGTQSTLTVTLSAKAPPAGCVVSLASSDSARAQVAATLPIPAGTIAASTQVSTVAGPPLVVTLTASLPGSAETATLHIT